MPRQMIAADGVLAVVAREAERRGSVAQLDADYAERYQRAPGSLSRQLARMRRSGKVSITVADQIGTFLDVWIPDVVNTAAPGRRCCACGAWLRATNTADLCATHRSAGLVAA